MALAAQQAAPNVNVNEFGSGMIPLVNWEVSEMVGQRIGGNFSESVVRQRHGVIRRIITNDSGTISAVWGGELEATQRHGPHGGRLPMRAEDSEKAATGVATGPISIGTTSERKETALREGISEDKANGSAERGSQLRGRRGGEEERAAPPTGGRRAGDRRVGPADIARTI